MNIKSLSDNVHTKAHGYNSNVFVCVCVCHHSWSKRNVCAILNVLLHTPDGPQTNVRHTKSWIDKNSETNGQTHSLRMLQITHVWLLVVGLALFGDVYRVCVPINGTASDVVGIDSATRLRNTVKERRIVTPEIEKKTETETTQQDIEQT